MNHPIDLSDVILTTERLTLRPWRLSDLDDFFAYASVDGVGQMAGWNPHKSKEESLAILQMFLAGKKTFAIEYEGKVIGSLGIEKYNEALYPELEPLRCRELGFVLSKAYWGMGLMPEAVREVIRYLFETVRLDAILCGNFLWNRQSARVQEKCGFRFYRNVTFETQYGTVEPTEDRILYRPDRA